MYETFFSRRAALVFDSVERFVLPGFFFVCRVRNRGSVGSTPLSSLGLLEQTNGREQAGSGFR